MFFDVAAMMVIIALFIARYTAVHVPYFWDELGVYVPGALHMKDGGTIGLLPANLEPEYSRGHPLLFYFVTASFFQVFGDSLFMGHLFALLCGCVTLFIFYRFSKAIFNPLTALIAVIILAYQPIYYTMSGVIFPEMLLTLFSIVAIWGIVKEKWGMYAVSASLAILVKEPAVVLPATAGLILLLESWQEKDFFTARRWRRFFMAAIPYFVFGLFIVIQKLQHGWYFFPYHVGFMSFGISTVVNGVKRMLLELFVEQGRWLFTIPLIVFLIKSKIWKAQGGISRYYMVAVLFVLISLGFSSVNFYLSRYLLFVYPIVVLAFAHSIVTLSSDFLKQLRRNIAIVGVLVLGFVIALREMDNGKFEDTYNMSYVHTVNCVQECVAWLEQQPWSQQEFGANFPIFQAIEDKRNGYLKKNERLPFTNNFDNGVRYLAYFYLSEEDIFPHLRVKKVIKRFSNKHSHIVVYDLYQ
jgi:4-amino-4-deoxy-L-arabinose transferase-like glycosyltransferase